MNLRPAVTGDLAELKALYTQITENLNRNGICIWDEVYPNNAFAGDIERGGLYVLEKEGEIISAFALCGANDDEGTVKWEKDDAQAFYLYRLGVKASELNKGIGSLMLSEAAKISKEKGAEYLRLFVVDFNEPAIRLYLKNGYRKAEGFYMNIFDDLVLKEYGYEIKL